VAVDQTPTQTSEPFLKGSLIWRKMGPLPVWAWALIVLGVALAWVSWRRNRAAGNEAATGYTDELPGNQSAPAIFVVPQVTVPSAPPAGGRPHPPGGGTGVRYLTLGPSLGVRETTGRERDLYDWLKDIGGPKYGMSDMDQLRALNPGLDKSLNWRPRPGGPKSPVFKSPTAVRVR
jgi:hypothetical protein